MKTEAEHLGILRKYVRDKKSVPHMEVREAVIFFRSKERPDFIPAPVWQAMLSWG